MLEHSSSAIQAARAHKRTAFYRRKETDRYMCRGKVELAFKTSSEATRGARPRIIHTTQRADRDFLHADGACCTHGPDPPAAPKSHTRTSPSSLPLRICVSVNWRHVTAPRWPKRVCEHFPSSRDQTERGGKGASGRIGRRAEDGGQIKHELTLDGTIVRGRDESERIYVDAPDAFDWMRGKGKGQHAWSRA